MYTERTIRSHTYLTTLPLLIQKPAVHHNAPSYAEQICTFANSEDPPSRVSPSQISSTNPSPKANSHQSRRDARDTPSPRPHAEARTAPQDLLLALPQLVLAREVAVRAKTDEGGAS